MSKLWKTLKNIFRMIKNDLSSVKDAGDSSRDQMVIQPAISSSHDPKGKDTINADPAEHEISLSEQTEPSKLNPLQADPMADSESDPSKEIVVPTFKKITVMRPVDPGWKITAPLGSVNKILWPSRGYHGGTDFGCPIGTCVFAALPGVVIVCEERKKEGGMVYVLWNKYSQQIGHAYFHLSEFFCKTGDNVYPGQLIALSGNTGKSTGPHLHFQIEDYQTKALFQPEFFGDTLMV